MTSKRKLRAEIERLQAPYNEAWLAGYRFGLAHGAMILGVQPVDMVPWTEHLARVTDAAREDAYVRGFKDGSELPKPPALSAPFDNPKMLRESLCRAQLALHVYYRYGEGSGPHVERMGQLIDVCDELRPLGPDGKHGDLHTPWCGCDLPSAPAKVAP